MPNKFSPGCKCCDWCGIWQDEPGGRGWTSLAQVDISGVVAYDPSPPPMTPFHNYEVAYYYDSIDHWVYICTSIPYPPPIKELPNERGWCRSYLNPNITGPTPLPRVRGTGPPLGGSNNSITPQDFQRWKTEVDAWLAAYVPYYWSEHPTPDIDQMLGTTTINGSCWTWGSAWYLCPEIIDWQNPWHNYLIYDPVHWKVTFAYHDKPYKGATDPNTRKRVFTLNNGYQSPLCGSYQNQCRPAWSLTSETVEETEDKYEFDTAYEFTEWDISGEPPFDVGDLCVTVTIPAPEEEEEE